MPLLSTERLIRLGSLLCASICCSTFLMSFTKKLNRALTLGSYCREGDMMRWCSSSSSRARMGQVFHKDMQMLQLDVL